jgi:hypothetical protein
MNIKEIQNKIFEKFNIKIEQDDPIIAVILSNKAMMDSIKTVLQKSKETNANEYKQLKIEIKEFLDSRTKRLDFKESALKKDLKEFQSKYIEMTNKIYEENLIQIENKIKETIQSTDYTDLNKEVSNQMESTLKHYLQEVRVGINIQKKGIENLTEIHNYNESTLQKLENRISVLTTFAFFQTIMFGASITLLIMLYFSSQNGFFFCPDTTKEKIKEHINK